MAVAEAAFRLIAAGFAAFALLFFVLLWIVPPHGTYLRSTRLGLLAVGQGPAGT